MFDMVTTLPLEVMAFAVPYDAVRAPVVQYCALVHTLRAVRLKGLLKFTVLISLTVHYVACIWYLLACQVGVCRLSTWAEGAGEYKLCMK